TRNTSSDLYSTRRKNGVQDRLRKAGLWDSASAATKLIADVVDFQYDHRSKLDEIGKLPFAELWPVEPGEMSVPMQVFLDPRGPFYQRLSPEEKEQLHEAKSKWPEYPLKIQELAARYGERPPWQTLPDADKHPWDKYRLKPME